MAATCSNCGAQLGFRRRLRGASLCEDCDRAQREAREEAITALKQTMRRLLHAEDRSAVVALLPAITERAGMDAARLGQLKEQAAREMVEEVLDDEYLSEEEEQALEGAVGVLALPEERVKAVLTDLAGKYIIARVNAGRLPEMPDSPVLLKRGEVAHYVVAASLMKEVVQREMRGGSTGFSVPIAKGVRFRTGAFRAKSVVVGTSLEVADTGTLTITSRRAVYKGLRKTVETPFTRLIGVNVFNDGIQLHASNRQNAPLFRVADGYVVAAVVNAAWQRLT